jgi:hypothetical protein
MHQNYLEWQKNQILSGIGELFGIFWRIRGEEQLIRNKGVNDSSLQK